MNVKPPSTAATDASAMMYRASHDATIVEGNSAYNIDRWLRERRWQ
jgi:hypothetical protein